MSGLLYSSGLSPKQTELLGIYEGLTVSEPTMYLDMFKKTQSFPSKTTQLTFDYKNNKAQAADLVKKGGIGKGVTYNGDFVRVTVTPGDVYTDDILTADELSRMQGGETEVFRIGGQNIKTGQQLMAQKLERIKLAMNKRMNMMCAQLINNGKVSFSDGVNELDFGIPNATTFTYNAATVFLKELALKLADYRKKTGISPDKILVGADVVNAMLGDTKVQQSMYNMGFTNIAKDMQAGDNSLVIGTFMGKMLEQMDLSFDAKGVEIIPGTSIKMLSTTQLAQGYTAIEVVDKNGDPALYQGEIFVDIETKDKRPAKSIIFAKSGFFPIVVDPQSIYTINVTIA